MRAIPFNCYAASREELTTIILVEYEWVQEAIYGFSVVGLRSRVTVYALNADTLKIIAKVGPILGEALPNEIQVSFGISTYYGDRADPTEAILQLVAALPEETP